MRNYVPFSHDEDVLIYMHTRHFYSSLTINRMSMSQLLAEAHLFQDVPDDWHVIITDIKNSTGAFGQGFHQEVNLIATGSIISTLNLAYKAGIQVPFFFGGDGATMIVPPELLHPALDALHVHRTNSFRNFQLDLRVGSVAVSSLKSEDCQLKISRVYLTDQYSIPVILGDGLASAEKIIKGGTDESAYEPPPDASLDLTGMECRWDVVKPARLQHEIVCLLIYVTTPLEQSAIFKEVIDVLDTIYGGFTTRNPVSVSNLHLDASFQKLSREIRATTGRLDLLQLVKNWGWTLIGKWFYLKRESGKEYVRSLVALTDTLVIDGRINTVIAGTAAQREALEERLNHLEQEGRLTYGLFVSQESVMSCYVQDRTENHIHFVDGADGGYTMASRMLKQKMSKKNVQD